MADSSASPPTMQVILQGIGGGSLPSTSAMGRRGCRAASKARRMARKLAWRMLTVSISSTAGDQPTPQATARSLDARRPEYRGVLSVSCLESLSPLMRRFGVEHRRPQRQTGPARGPSPGFIDAADYLNQGLMLVSSALERVRHESGATLRQPHEFANGIHASTADVIRIHRHGGPEELKFETGGTFGAPEARAGCSCGRRLIGLEFHRYLQAHGALSRPDPRGARRVEAAGVVEAVGEGVSRPSKWATASSTTVFRAAPMRRTGMRRRTRW